MKEFTQIQDIQNVVILQSNVLQTFSYASINNSTIHTDALEDLSGFQSLTKISQAHYLATWKQGEKMLFIFRQELLNTSVVGLELTL